ncbi:MAG: hypothetical protein KatS3mg012_1760 [Gaiellaceae bacterium]|nr:MAG: hypothetical protein KatS3mg012_1760 [Gaiellaceae bacterium]
MTDAPLIATGRPSRLIERVDRLLPLAWLGLYALLPVSGLPDLMFTFWHDQARDLAALRELLEQGSSSAIDDNVIGPAYLLAAASIHWVFGLSPESALVALARASYAVSVAMGLVMVRLLLRRTAAGAPLVSLSGQILFLGLMLVTAFWYWSDVPWSHFFAAALVVSFYVVRRVLPGSAGAAAAGALLGLLATTRTFELAAVVLAWALALALSVALPAFERSRVRLPTMAAFVGSFVATAAVVHLAAAKRAPFVYGYHPHPDQQDVLHAAVAESPTFSFGFIPSKLVQLFVDPCYLSLCQLADNSGVAFWRQPLLLQVPALLFLPAVVLALGWLSLRAVHPRYTSGRTGELRLMLEMAIAASGLVLGYVASTMAGSPHLKFGLARDFLLPALLVAILVAVLAVRATRDALARLDERRSRGGDPGGVGDVRVPLAALGLVALLALAVSVALSTGLPRFESKHLAAITYASHCSGSVCRVQVVGRTTAGVMVRIPSPSVLAFACAGDDSLRAIYSSDPSRGVGLPDACRRPRLRFAWPAVMGLPPDLAHFERVTVTNRPLG